MTILLFFCISCIETGDFFYCLQKRVLEAEKNQGFMRNFI